MAVSTKPLLPPKCTTVNHMYNGFYSATAIYFQLSRNFPLRIHHLTVDLFHLYFSAIESSGTYLIPLRVLALSNLQVSTPDSSTTVDVIRLYFPTVRSSDMYFIPSGSFVLTNMQVRKAKFTQTVDLIKLDRQPLIHILHQTPALTYLSCIF